MKLEIRKIGNSSGIILPRELMAQADLRQGQWLHVTRNADGSLTLTVRDETFDKGMAIAEKAMKTYRNTLAELAK